MWFLARYIRLLGALVALTLVLSACGSDRDHTDAGSGDDSGGDDSGDDGGDNNSSFIETTDDSSGDDVVAAEPEAGALEPVADALAVPTALTTADIGRDIIFTATIVVQSADVAQTSREATQIITGLGGIVFGQSTTLDPEPRSVLTFKVLPERFDDALDALAGVGELVDQTISADDVTERVVDLESRITTAEASVDRLRTLLIGATDLKDVAELEKELVDRETQLETLRGQLRTVEDQVSLATITMTITQQGLETLPAEILVDSWLGETVEEACPGSAELAVDRGAHVTWCVEFENTGDVALLDLELESDTLRLRTADFNVNADALARLEPGERAVATIKFELDEGRVRRRDARGGIFLDIHVRATPADAPDQTVAMSGEALLIADGAEPLPGFADAFGGSVGALGAIGSVLLLALGGLLPFLPLLLAAAWLVRRLSVRQAAKRAD